MAEERKLIWFLGYDMKYSKYTDHLFVDAGEKLGIDVKLIDIDRFKFVIDENDNMVWYYKKELVTRWPDLIIDRLGKTVKHFYKELFRTYCDMMKIRMVPTTKGMGRARDKLLTHMILAKNKIKSPELALVKPGVKFDKKMKFPLILKNRFRSLGQGIYLVNSKEQIEGIIGKMRYTEFFVQKFIEESKGVDIRVLLAGNKIIGAYKRTNKKSYKSNMAVGGTAELIEKIPTKLKRSAIKISKAFKLDIIGIDFLIKGDDYLVLEVNHNPGLFGLLDEKTKEPKVDFAIPIIKAMIKIIEDRSKRKEKARLKKEAKEAAKNLLKSL
jgi:ribosomal protein S6--L-glutamate ligase